MEQWFTTFNGQYFDGGLPLPRLALSRSKTRRWASAPSIGLVSVENALGINVVQAGNSFVQRHEIL